jgi:hypothetical protein
MERPRSYAGITQIRFRGRPSKSEPLSLASQAPPGAIFDCGCSVVERGYCRQSRNSTINSRSRQRREDVPLQAPQFQSFHYTRLHIRDSNDVIVGVRNIHLVPHHG